MRLDGTGYMEAAGEARQFLAEDGTPLIADTGNQWKCIYHTDRAMIECIMRIDKLIG